MAIHIPKRIKLLKGILALAAIYFFIAALSHLFGWTVFPFYDGNLYSPYHDTLLALCDLIFVLLFLMIARDPVKNIDAFNLVVIALFLAIIFNMGIIWKIDFELLGSTEKKFQTVAETALAVFLLSTLLILKPQITLDN